MLANRLMQLEKGDVLREEYRALALVTAGPEKQPSKAGHAVSAGAAARCGSPAHGSAVDGGCSNSRPSPTPWSCSRTTPWRHRSQNPDADGEALYVYYASKTRAPGNTVAGGSRTESSAGEPGGHDRSTYTVPRLPGQPSTSRRGSVRRLSCHHRDVDNMRYARHTAAASR